MRALVLLLALVFPSLALAKNVGVIVTGSYLRSPTLQQAEAWMRAKGHKVVTNPMPAEAVKTLLDCFVIDDSKCMRGIVEARAVTAVLVSIRIDVASKKQREIRLTIDWFAKGHAPVTTRRTCDGCTEAVLRSTIDAILDDLAKDAPGFTGSIKITSSANDLTVLLDGKTIGVTPLETTVPIGAYKLQLVKDGRMGPEKAVDVDGDKPIAVVLEAPAAAAVVEPPPPPPPVVVTAHRRSRLIPGLMIGIGLAGIGAGGALYYTSEEPDGSGRTYRDTKNLGIGVAAGGGALLITGVIIILVTKSTTGPTVSLTPGGGAAIGWTGSF